MAFYVSISKGLSCSEIMRNRPCCRIIKVEQCTCFVIVTIILYFVKAKTVVIRSCWNSSGVENLDEDFLDCNKMASIGESCYCNKDLDNGKPCNDGQFLNSFLTLVMTAVVAAIAFIM